MWVNNTWSDHTEPKSWDWCESDIGSFYHIDTCKIPESSKLAEKGQPIDGEAIDKPVQDEDDTVDGQHDVLGGQITAAIGSTGAKQDDDLDKLRQREVHARGASPLCKMKD